MSNTDPAPEAVSLRAGVVDAVDVLEARKAAIGDGTEVRRLLPQRVLRTIGAWCFLDHYGPDDTSGGPGMQVPLVMWWNFVARTAAEITAARDAWIAGDFGEVRGYAGNPLAAPPLPPGGLKAR